MKTPLIYVAHPFGGDMVKLAAAEQWVAYLCRSFPAIFWAPWIPLCRHWPDSGESRKRGLELDLAAVRRSYGVILVGGEVSPGMTLERDAAHVVWDWSGFRTPEDFERANAESQGFEFAAFGGWLRQVYTGGAQ